MEVLREINLVAIVEIIVVVWLMAWCVSQILEEPSPMIGDKIDDDDSGAEGDTRPRPGPLSGGPPAGGPWRLGALAEPDPMPVLSYLPAIEEIQETVPRVIKKSGDEDFHDGAMVPVS